MKTNYIALLILIATLSSCKDNKKGTNSIVTKQTEEATAHPGKKLMETYCYACHNPTTSEDSRIAPPMIAIKKHYISENTAKETFTNDMLVWMKKPSEDISKMPGAVKRFGVMPVMVFPDHVIKQIAEYMYDYNIDQPEWFEEHYKQRQGMGMGKNMKNANSLQDLSYADRGLKYALATKAVLGKNLMGTINKKGTLEALQFCNERAYPLTDSMAVAQNASIKRVSDKARNPQNSANNEELSYINTFKKQMAAGETTQPLVVEKADQVTVYYPISTNSMCLQCHGKPNTDIRPETSKLLGSLYPNDKAVGYDINQIRGIWKVNFSK